ncbi:surface antigen BspA-like [Trichomonas vaginalis G3]|uniref:Surface antigen BspA-like n=1 Tax=Trichomonas vaginalis (strain ATCC PRA-98 / G3) TaxID=412133 RepID=A2DFB7_TRIV3|nr:ribonuclease inhibitor domain-containing protein [Trichomonas vaginalis G3]EAY20845.1 surface antigen BspA-like [Trichomonas vaginalis G3]KAI5521544.1 ribonuclease inhibitor domain-containing protein [Trichomonas vaginalis G3]|eukprot:XP_001581831.1 surface antigen BspA-like [Trichomonas vaginalis G3]
MKFGKSLEYIHDNAFRDCEHLELIEFSECNKATIGAYSFNNCKNLKRIVFANNITKIGKNCFSNCISLSDVIFPSSLEYINAFAFSRTGILNVSFPLDSKLISLGVGCFSECRNLSYISLPQSVNEIQQSCFELTNISSFVVPNHTEYISDYAFKDCSNLRTFTIPSNCSLRRFGNLFFEGCSSLSVIECPHSEWFCVDVGALYNKNETELICFPPASDIKFFNLPQTLETISSGAFIGCKNLVSISIASNSVKTIKQYAFANCSSLTFINIPICVQNIESSIFIGCNKLRCGVIIENRTTSFIKRIISVCLLNPKAIFDCDILSCQCIRIHSSITSHILYSFSIIFYLGIF